MAYNCTLLGIPITTPAQKYNLAAWSLAAFGAATMLATLACCEGEGLKNKAVLGVTLAGITSFSAGSLMLVVKTGWNLIQDYYYRSGYKPINESENTSVCGPPMVTIFPHSPC